jgi:hypothetical protein
LTCIPPVESLILSIRGRKVIVDSNLAALYGVTTKALNQAIKRNPDRFPSDFVFALTPEEKKEVVTDCDHLLKLKYSPVLPTAFTEHGALMAAMVLNSPRAVQMSVFVVRAFIKMREQLLDRAELGKRLADIKKTLMAHSGMLRNLYRKNPPAPSFPACIAAPWTHVLRPSLLWDTRSSIPSRTTTWTCPTHGCSCCLLMPDFMHAGRDSPALAGRQQRDMR